MWPAAGNSSVTQLRFLGHPDPNATATRRRLQLRDAWRVAGNLHTLGYFAADICVGTPPKSFNLIVGARTRPASPRLKTGHFSLSTVV